MNRVRKLLRMMRALGAAGSVLLAGTAAVALPATAMAQHR